MMSERWPSDSPPRTPRPLIPMGPKSSPKPSLIGDGLLFFGGAAVALLLFLAVYSFLSPPQFIQTPATLAPPPPAAEAEEEGGASTTTSTSTSFYDDPAFSYSITEEPIARWDEKRRAWMRAHPGSPAGRILMVTGSQPGPCPNPIGDHLLLRFYKNKADYCRIHGMELFYNTALLQPEMFSFWAKIPVVRAAMAAHPEAEWIWWVDSDAAFTDMDFALPLHRYRDHNLVLHGWPHLVYEARSWTSLNAGVFLIRNCQWSLDFLHRWARMGPQSPEYERWGQLQRSIFKDKLYPASDDQTGIAYLMLKEKSRWADKIYLESDFYFEGYWLEIVNKLETIESKYLKMEMTSPSLRRRRAEKDLAAGRAREEALEREGIRAGVEGWRRPFVTHFTGCQPCSGDHNKMYSGENCYEGMQKALNFADNQVLRAYGFRHRRLVNSTGVRLLPFDFPAG